MLVPPLTPTALRLRDFPVILFPFTYAVLPDKISPAPAFASLVNVPDTPKILVPALILPATKFASPLMV